jgi:hypothetical protein
MSKSTLKLQKNLTNFCKKFCESPPCFVATCLNLQLSILFKALKAYRMNHLHIKIQFLVIKFKTIPVKCLNKADEGILEIYTYLWVTFDNFKREQHFWA